MTEHAPQTGSSPAKSRSQSLSAAIAQNPGATALAVLLAAAFLWSYWPSLAYLAGVWGSDPDYSHGYLVPPLACLFLYMRRDKLAFGESTPAWGGLVLVALALVMRYYADKFFAPEFAAWSMIPWIAGVCWLWGGRPFFWWTLPSVAFLLFAMKLPGRYERTLSGPLRNIATDMSCWLLQFFGQPAFAEGNTINLDEHQLAVADACAGLRMSLGIVALAYAFVLLTDRPKWDKLVLALSAVPVAIVANVFRIVVTGFLYQYASGEVAEKFMHDLSGIAMIPVAAGLFFGVLWLLDHATIEVDTSQPAGGGSLLKSG